MGMSSAGGGPASPPEKCGPDGQGADPGSRIQHPDTRPSPQFKEAPGDLCHPGLRCSGACSNAFFFFFFFLLLLFIFPLFFLFKILVDKG